MGQQSTSQIWPDDPHSRVSSDNGVHEHSESPLDLDLESSLQFVVKGGVAHFDFSCYILARDKDEAIKERTNLQMEIDAWARLRNAVDDAHDKFLQDAFNVAASLNKVIES